MSTDCHLFAVREHLCYFLPATDQWHGAGGPYDDNHPPLTGRFRVPTKTRWPVPALQLRPFRAESRHATISFGSPNQLKGQPTVMEQSAEKTLNKHIRVHPEQWERIEWAAQGSALTANQLVIELAMQALDRHEWPDTEAEIRVARASLFTAQAIARDLISAGRGNEVEEIRDFISTIVPDPDAATAEKDTTASRTGTVPNDPD